METVRRFIIVAIVFFCDPNVAEAYYYSDPQWMFTDKVEQEYNETMFSDTGFRNTSYMLLDSSTSGYDGTPFIKFDYQFTSNPVFIDTIQKLDGPRIVTEYRPGYAGFKIGWDYGMIKFPISKYKYLIFAHKGPIAKHKVTIWCAQLYEGETGTPAYKDSLGTFYGTDSWKVDTIVIPENMYKRGDTIVYSWMNSYVFVDVPEYQYLFITINNLNSNDTTSGPPGCLELDDIFLAGRSPFCLYQRTPLIDTVNNGDADTLSFCVKAQDTTEHFSYQWKKDGIIINGATDSVYHLTCARESDAGVYTVTVTSSRNNLSFTSDQATLRVAGSDPKCGCGAGTGLALLPPFFFKIKTRIKPKKRVETA